MLFVTPMAKLTLQELENLSRLLLSEADSNILLALEILKNHKKSIPILSRELVLVWQLHNDYSLKLDIEALLKEHYLEKQMLQWEKGFEVFRLLPSIYSYSPRVQRLIKDHENVRSDYQSLMELNAIYCLNYYTIAKKLHQSFKKHLELAEDYYRIALRSNPTHKDTLFYLAFLLDKEPAGYEEALQLYLKVESIDPRSSAALNNIGLIYDNTSRNEEAYQYYSKALAINPYSSLYLRNLASLCTNRMEGTQYKQQAKELLQKLIEIDPTTGSNWNSWADYLWNVEKDYKAAERAYLRGLDVSPENHLLLGNLGELYIDVYKKHDQGLILYQQALKIKVSTYRLVTMITVLVLHFKDYGSAKKYLQQLIALSPPNQIERNRYLRDDQWNLFLEAKEILKRKIQ